MSFKVVKGKFGTYDTVSLIDSSNGSSAEIALMGATLLKYNIKLKDSFFNIIDGFENEEELKAARGARSWIMIPFANRIPGGKYHFDGKEYQLIPVPPRTQVIHGFASLHNYKIKSLEADEMKAETVLELDEIRPGKYQGYPFSLNIYVSFTLDSKHLSIKVKAENVGDIPAPFGTGWHPYFKTSENGIENLIFTLKANKVIRLDEAYIPLPGNQAYADINEYPELNFNPYMNVEKRIINKRKLDDCYAGLIKDDNGIASCSLEDPENGMKIIMFQKGGVTLAFSGDSLAQRKRKSVALEPMQFLTNAFNREEFSEQLTILPGSRSVFEFGVKVTSD